VGIPTDCFFGDFAHWDVAMSRFITNRQHLIKRGCNGRYFCNRVFIIRLIHNRKSIVTRNTSQHKIPYKRQ